MTEGPGSLRGIWGRHDSLRFLVVGAWNTAFGYLAFAGLYLAMGRRYLVAAILSHVLAVTQAFLVHRRVTFRSQGRHWGEFLRFNLTYVGGLLLSLVGLPALVELAGVPPLLAQAGLILGTSAMSFVLHRIYTFRKGPDPDG